MASGGTYRISNGVTSWEAPAPVETSWDEQQIDTGLNGISILTGYRLHSWNIGELEGCDAEALFDLLDEQQANNSPLAELETDPYQADLAEEAYGTRTYTDFVVLPFPRVRGLPQYRNINIPFEIWVG